MHTLSRCLSGLALVAPTLLWATPPHYDHVVIVVEENRYIGQIIGDRVNCPYLNTLADGGVSFSDMYALVHPSQPNYLHLFSGSAQSVTDDSTPAGIPFTTANFGAALRAKGVSFLTYNDGLPTAGDFTNSYSSSTTTKYRRKHCPWTNWMTTATPLSSVQIAPSVHLQFTSFPTSANYASLPAVSYVIPDQDHDMHDGSRAAGDAWLQTNMGAYATWATTHNSLLIVTWDEDDYGNDNRIATIFYGAHLKNGSTDANAWTLHNITRTLEDMHGTTHSGRMAQVKPIYGVFDTDFPTRFTSLRQGLNGYTGVVDTFIHADAPDAAAGTVEDLSVDGDYGTATGIQPAQSLIRYDSLFGSGVNQVPAGGSIVSAKLFLFTGTGTSNESAARMDLFRMNTAWSGASTWNTLVGGVTTDGTNAAATATFTGYASTTEALGTPIIFDVTDDVNLWRTGTINNGWVVQTEPGGTDGWVWKSSEAAADVTRRPRLDLTWLSGFQTWASSYALPGNTTLTAGDADADGLNLIIEYAFGLNPTLATRKLLDASNTPALPLVTPTGTTPATRFLQVEYLRRKNPSAYGLTYTPQFGASTTTFLDATTPETVTSVDATWERVLVKDAIAPATRRFGRVKITLVP